MKAYAALGGIGPSSAEAGASEGAAEAGGLSSALLAGGRLAAAAARVTGGLRTGGLAAAAGSSDEQLTVINETEEGGRDGWRWVWCGVPFLASAGASAAPASAATTTGPSSAIFGFFEPKGLASSGLKAYAALGGIGPSSAEAGFRCARASSAFLAAAAGGRFAAAAARVTGGLRTGGLAAAAGSSDFGGATRQEKVRRGRRREERNGVLVYRSWPLWEPLRRQHLLPPPQVHRAPSSVFSNRRGWRPQG